MKIRGNRIELGEVETAILGHRAVAEAAVIDWERTPGEKYLAAYVVTRQPTESADGQAELIQDLRRLLKSALPDYMVPQTFTFLRTLPRLPNGKLDRRTLPTPDAQKRQESCYVAPRTPTEKKLAAIWAEVLRVERVGLHDNFFELGGHSLLAVRVMVQIRAAMSVDLPVADLFAGPTVAELADRVESARRGETPASPQPTPLVEEIAASLLGPSTGSQQSLVPLRTDGAATPLFCIHGLGGHVAAFLPLARGLPQQRPVYGLQGRGSKPASSRTIASRPWPPST